jgi:aspartate aminotransferase
LHHEGKHKSIARFYPEGTIISGGISKWCGAGGWRLGTFTFPSSLKWLLDAMAVVASETFTSTSAPIQYASVRAFRIDDKMNDYLRKTRSILKALGGMISCTLNNNGIFTFEPEGGFYLFPDFFAHREKLLSRGIISSNKLCERILEETGVAMLPGSVFGRPESELTARIAYVNFNGENALKAADGLKDNEPVSNEFIKEFCSDTIEAIDKISDWVS